MGKPKKKTTAAPAEKAPLHTPEPWDVEYDPDADGHVIRMATNIESPGRYQTHHRVEYDHGLLPGEKNERARAQFAQAEANAHLMGAAPELLAACEKQRAALHSCVQHLLGKGPLPDPEQLAIATLAGEKAIAKATKYEPLTEWNFDDDTDEDDD